MTIREKDWRKLVVSWAIIVASIPFITWTIRCNFLVMEIARDVGELQTTVSNLPPDEFERRVEKLEAWERENRDAHSRIEVGQGVIQTKIDAQSESIDKIETLIGKLHIPE